MNSHPQPRVLIVDDIPANIWSVKEVLSDLPVVFHEAESGLDALKKILEHDYALILMDVQMPEMTGFEAAELIYGHQRDNKTPIMFLTAQSNNVQSILKGYDIGAVDYMTKPLNPFVLQSRVSVFIDLYIKKQQLSTQLQQIQQLSNQFHLVIESAALGIISFDRELTIKTINSAALSMLGANESECLRQPLKDVLFEQLYRHHDFVNSSFYHSLRNRKNFSSDDLQFWNQSSRHTFPVEVTVGTVNHEDESQVMGVILFQDITQRKKAENRLTYLAQYDQLTGLANRNLFHSMLKNTLAKAKRGGHQVNLLFIDLDNFKDINDTFGHDAGDLLLKQAAERLGHTTRDTDTLARLGGDEFAIVLAPDENDNFPAAYAAERIVSHFKKSFTICNQNVFVGTSVGIASFPDNAATMEDLIKSADTAMYQAKNLGKNQFAFFNQSMQQELKQQLLISTSLHTALEKGEFSVFYQPQLDIKQGKIYGVEALIRWNSPLLGQISPAQFIPVAEQNGLIEELGEWTLEQSCEEAKSWLDNKLVDNLKLNVSVNISAKQLRNDRLSSTIKTIIEKTGLPTDSLNVELTETALMSDPDVAIQEIARIHDLGVDISVDDFGTGYSSLNYLRQLSINCLKIDKSFVDKIGASKSDESIIEAIINLASALSLQVIAEGVESQSQADFLLKHNCHLMQGYLFSKPLSSEQLVDFFKSYQSDLFCKTS
ncbi:EAL domain-containing protein [Pleionea sp. CnH1-48]|uniref:two-component system response regulator n=1 Tax=Pleionea sp. CnH1-48 TaxID=2954494 RepID=UPI0020985340|nr:EAL domain-containing protein [Pleionea sp. CnH1-48]